MPKQKNNNAPSPAKPGTPEPNTDAAEATVSNADGTENQGAPIASDGLEDTAPPAPGTAAPTSPQEDTSEAGTTTDEAASESQVPAAPSNTHEDNLTPIAEPSSKLDVVECFKPLIVQDAVAPAPTPKPK